MVAISVWVFHQTMWAAIDAEQTHDPHLQAGFFQGFPNAGFDHAFTRLHTPTRQTPPPIVRPAGQENPLSSRIENSCRTSERELAEYSNAFTFDNLCH